MKAAEGERGAHPLSDDISKGPISLLQLLDMKVKTEVDNRLDLLLEY